MSLRERIIQALEKRDLETLLEIARDGNSVFRVLISLAYDREQLICWRAIEALGVLAGHKATTDHAGARGLVQRILWMMREESGNNPWSAPDMLGEIVRNSPDEFSDIAPIIVPFHEEEILGRGVLRAIVRIGEIRPDLVPSAGPLVSEYIRSEDPYLRYYAIKLAGILGTAEYLREIKELVSSTDTVRIYENGEMIMAPIGATAENVLESISKGRAE